MPFTVYSLLFIPFSGGGKRIRTADHLVANQALSQLSYTPINLQRLNSKSQAKKIFKNQFLIFDIYISNLFFLVGLGRFELPTSRLSGVRSSHLSYRPSYGWPYSTQPSQPSSDGYPILSKLNSKSRVGIDLEIRFYRFESVNTSFLRKEVIQPQVPLRLPCYDFTPIINHTLGAFPPCGLARRLLVQSTFVV